MNDKIEQAFTYHSPEPDQIPKYSAIRGKAKEFGQLLDDLLPNCADKSAAIRLLRECVMTANASIALKGLI